MPQIRVLFFRKISKEINANNIDVRQNTLTLANFEKTYARTPENSKNAKSSVKTLTLVTLVTYMSDVLNNASTIKVCLIFQTLFLSELSELVFWQ